MIKANKDTFDVAIVGGGAAGCAAALDLAQRGFHVALMERREERHEGFRVGETLCPEACPVLCNLGVWNRLGAVSSRSPGLVSCWGTDVPSERDHVFGPFGDALHLDRSAFETLLIDAAAEAGAVVRRGVGMASLCRGGDGWHIFHQGQALRARFLLLATGRGWPVGAPPARRDHTPHRLIAVVAVVGSALPEGVDPDPRTWVESSADGWWYTTPLPCGRMVAAFLTDLDIWRAAQDDAGSAADAWLRAFATAPHTRRRLQGLTGDRRFPVRCVAADSYCRTPACGPDWAAAGDAALTVDPLSGQGIRRALESGVRAAQVAMETLVSGKASQSAQAVRTMYHQALSAQRWTDREIASELYGRETRWPESPFWQRRACPNLISVGTM